MKIRTVHLGDVVIPDSHDLAGSVQIVFVRLFLAVVDADGDAIIEVPSLSAIPLPSKWVVKHDIIGSPMQMVAVPTHFFKVNKLYVGALWVSKGIISLCFMC